MATFEAKCSTDIFTFDIMAIASLSAEMQEIPYLTLKTEGQGHNKK